MEALKLLKEEASRKRKAVQETAALKVMSRVISFSVCRLDRELGVNYVYPTSYKTMCYASLISAHSSCSLRTCTNSSIELCTNYPRIIIST